MLKVEDGRRCVGISNGGHSLGGTNLTSRADGDHENGQKVSLLACVANSETHIKIQFPKTALWGPYFIMFHCQQ